MTKYTTVREMTNEVNELYDLLGKAQKIANDIRRQNFLNYVCLFRNSEEALKDTRPLTIEMRKEEALKYQEFFEGLHDQIINLSESIGQNY